MNRTLRILLIVLALLMLCGCGAAAGSSATGSLDIEYWVPEGAEADRLASLRGLLASLRTQEPEESLRTPAPFASDEEQDDSADSISRMQAERKLQTTPTPQPQDKDALTAKATPTPQPNTCTLTIRCDTAVAKGMHLDPKWSGIVPASGVILKTTTMTFRDGDTVFDVICAARDKYKFHMEYSGSKGTQYIEGINNLYEFDGGRWSGWMYCVNGWYPNYGCGQYAVKSGDVIEWNYTCDLGKDLGQTWMGS